MSKAYSLNGEEYLHTEMHDAVVELHDDGELKLGNVYVIWEGDTSPVDIGLNASWLIEQMQEQAYHEAGEWSESYLDDVTSEQVAELQTGLDSLLENWLEAHNLYPNFYTVTNAEKMRFKITELSESDFNYEPTEEEVSVWEQAR